MRVTRLMTILHVVSDLEAADRWYRAVLGSTHLFRQLHDGVGGAASRHSIADITIEPVEPAPDSGTNVAMFHGRFGQGLYSTAWLVADLPSAYHALHGLGVRMYDVAGKPLAESPHESAMFTHPRDSFGLLEFALEARHRESLAIYARESEPGENHLGLVRTLSVDIGVDHPGRARRFYDRLGQAGSSNGGPTSEDWPFGVRPAFEIHERSANHEGPFGVTFEVRSIDATVRHLASHGVSFERHNSGAIRTDPADSFGVLFSFTEQRGMS